MKTFITSDIHFSHKNIIKFCPDSRPFESIEEMNSTIIQRWNDTVSPNDKVYILGDLSFASVDDTYKLISSLNGNLNLIKGNHDRILDSGKIKSLFHTFREYDEIKYNDQNIVLFHFPIHSWNKKHYGSIHLHGHTHANKLNPPISGRIKDVGMDGNNLYPYDLDLIIEDLLKIEIFGNHHD